MSTSTTRALLHCTAMMLLVAGCGKSETAGPTPTTSIAAESVGAPAAAVSAKAKSDQLPGVETPSDLEERAAQAVTEENVEERVAELETELGSED